MTRAVPPADAAPPVPASPVARVVSIQYLRALAAFAVVGFHIMEASPKWRFPIGAAGVDIFFVISGFIMQLLLAARPQTPGVFLGRRVLRLGPPYWIVTALATVAAVVKPRVFWMVKVSLGGLISSALFVPYVDASGQMSPVVLQGWTLDYEMFFYVVFAAVLFAPARLQLGLVSGALLALAALHPFVPSWPPARLGTDPLLIEFLAGVWLGEAFVRGRALPPAAAIAAAVAAVAGFAGAELLDYRPDVWRPLVWGAPAALLVAAALSWELRGRVPEISWLNFLGDSSYSLYLLHVIALAIASVVFLRFGFTAYAAGGLVLAIGTSAAFYCAVERPLHKAAFRLTSRRRSARAAAPQAAAG